MARLQGSLQIALKSALAGSSLLAKPIVTEKKAKSSRSVPSANKPRVDSSEGDGQRNARKSFRKKVPRNKPKALSSPQAGKKAKKKQRQKELKQKLEKIAREKLEKIAQEKRRIRMLAPRLRTSSLQVVGSIWGRGSSSSWTD